MGNMTLKFGGLLGLGLAATFAATAFVAPAAADEARGGDHSIAVFAGQATRTSFVESMFMPWTNDMQDIGVVAAAYNYRFGTLGDFIGDGLPLGLGDDITIEGEIGGSARFGDENLGEGWIGAYLRYDDFFWNDHVYTTIAVNTGLSYLSEKSEFERSRDNGGRADKLLHYLAPEITFAAPSNKDLEFLLRFHHRSGAFGFFDGVVSGSTFISTGLRVRF
jgi:hypothetical protein